MGVDPFARVLPDMAGDGALGPGVAGAGGEQPTGAAFFGIGFVVAIVRAIRHGVGERLVLRATIDIRPGVLRARVPGSPLAPFSPRRRL